MLMPSEKKIPEAHLRNHSEGREHAWCSLTSGMNRFQQDAAQEGPDALLRIRT